MITTGREWYSEIRRFSSLVAVLTRCTHTRPPRGGSRHRARNRVFTGFRPGPTAWVPRVGWGTATTPTHHVDDIPSMSVASTGRTPCWVACSMASCQAVADSSGCDSSNSYEKRASATQISKSPFSELDLIAPLATLSVKKSRWCEGRGVVYVSVYSSSLSTGTPVTFHLILWANVARSRSR